MNKEHVFTSEADLCAAFIAALPDGWVAYPETGGFDILLARKADGFQIGVEAKLRLNAKVVTQAAESAITYMVDTAQPDCRAVLVPYGVNRDLAEVCRLLGITIIDMPSPSSVRARYGNSFWPELPKASSKWEARGWFERCPTKRIELPDWVPDVVAGASAPVALTLWKIGAIKLVVTLERRGYLSRGDFKHFDVSMSRWTQERWLLKDGRGGWVAGPNLPDFRAQHPVNFDQIAADYEKWKSPEAATQPGMFVGGPA